MKQQRATYQNGSVVLDRRRKIWYFRWRENGIRKSKRLGTLDELPKKKDAKAKAAGQVLKINDQSETAPAIVTVNAVVQRYISEEMPARFSTRKGYEAYLHGYIIPAWGDKGVQEVKPYEAERWLNELKRNNGKPMTGKTKAQIKGLLHMLLEWAMKWGYIELQRNPISLVNIKGGIKRKKHPRVLSVEEFNSLLSKIPDEPFRTMILIDMGLGLGCSELFALKWSDVDFKKLTVHVQRGIVAGRVDEVKTIYRDDLLPLDPALANVLKVWKETTEFQSDTDWIWASPFQAGEKPYSAWGVQQRHLKPAAEAAGLGPLGWHSLRHTYRSWLDATGAPIGVQQKLMRHGDIRTTMNVYGDALMQSKRDAHSKVVQMAFRGNGPQMDRAVM